MTLEHNIGLVVQMETPALYTLAAKFRIDVLSILTMSYSLATGNTAAAEQCGRVTRDGGDRPGDCALTG